MTLKELNLNFICQQHLFPKRLWLIIVVNASDTDFCEEAAEKVSFPPRHTVHPHCAAFASPPEHSCICFAVTWVTLCWLSAQ